jgi:hypothetical protein
MYVQLKHGDLTKRGGDRLSKFVDMAGEGSTFLTSKGPIVLDLAKSPYKGEKLHKGNLLRIMNVSGFSHTFNAKKPGGGSVQVKYPTDFLKTPEFGGKGAGSGTVAEDRALTEFRSELAKAMEAAGLPYVEIKINGRVVRAVDAGQPKGTPKADFFLTNEKGEQVAWLSHKDGSSAKDFQQWGGITELSKKYPNHPEIESFVEAVRQDSGGAMDGKKSYARDIKDPKLIRAAVYGIDYGGAPGLQNVDILLQGRIKLTKSGKHFVFSSSHTMVNGEIPQNGYGARFFTRKGDRDNFGIKNSRFMVAPKELRRASTVEI